MNEDNGFIVVEAALLNLVDEPMLYIVDPAIDESVLNGKTQTPKQT